MAPARDETVDAFYATLDRDELVSPGAFDRHGAIESFTRLSLQIDGTIEVGPADRASGSASPETCDVCTARHYAGSVRGSTSDPLPGAIEYVLQEGPFLEGDPSTGVPDVYVVHDHESVSCEYCEGRGEFECSSCEGAGHQTCALCDGSGRRRSRRVWRTECEWCGGAGWVPCSRCSGSGTIQCTACSGDGTRHAYDASCVRTETKWRVDGLPDDWGPEEHALDHTVAQFGLPESAFYLSATGSTSGAPDEPTSIRISAPDLQAGLLRVTYGDARYRGMLLEWEGGSRFAYDPQTGPIETSLGRKLHDLRSRVSRRGTRQRS